MLLHELTVSVYCLILSHSMAIPQFGYIMTSGHLVDHSLGILQIKVPWKFERFHFLFWKYWVDRKVHLGFPTRCYGKTPINFLAKPIPGNGIPSTVVAVLSLSRDFVTPQTAACQASLTFTVSLSLLKFMPIELVMPPTHLILCCPILLLPLIFPRNRSRLFNVSAQSTGASASASVLPMNIQGWFPFSSVQPLS